MRRFILIIGFVLTILFTTITIVAYARGYRLNLQNKTLSSTGVLSVSSYPEKASIFIDDKLVSATNSSLSYPPGWYQLRITKEGYQLWEKRIKIQGEVVTQIDALLIPHNPSLRALTVTGVSHASLSPNSSKVAYIIEEDKKEDTSQVSKIGIWVLEFRTGTLGMQLSPKQIFSDPNRLYDWKNSYLSWSPDEKQLLIRFIKQQRNKEVTGKAFVFTLDNLTNTPEEVTTSYTSFISLWEQEAKEKLGRQLDLISEPIKKQLLASARNINFSADETKIFYQASASASLPEVITPPLIGSNSTDQVRQIEKDNYYIYDNKEDKNFLLIDKKSQGNIQTLTWYSDSKHLLMIEKEAIVIVDYDGTNRRTIYAGPFEGNVLYSWPAGGKLIILTNLNKPQNRPNLYQIDLR